MTNTNRLEKSKLYTSDRLMNKIGLLKYMNLVSANKLTWITDNTKGEKLYKIMD